MVILVDYCLDFFRPWPDLWKYSKRQANRINWIHIEAKVWTWFRCQVIGNNDIKYKYGIWSVYQSWKATSIEVISLGYRNYKSISWSTVAGGRAGIRLPIIATLSLAKMPASAAWWPPPPPFPAVERAAFPAWRTRPGQPRASPQKSPQPRGWTWCSLLCNAHHTWTSWCWTRTSPHAPHQEPLGQWDHLVENMECLCKWVFPYAAWRKHVSTSATYTWSPQKSHMTQKVKRGGL